MQYLDHRNNHKYPQKGPFNIIFLLQLTIMIYYLLSFFTGESLP